MTYPEAALLAEELRPHFERGTLGECCRVQVEQLYWEVLRKRVKACNCRNRWADAFVETYTYLKREQRMKPQPKAQLKAGVILHYAEWPHVYTNDNLTDEVAREYLRLFPENTDLFAELPAEEETTEEAPEEETHTTKPRPRKAKH